MFENEDDYLDRVEDNLDDEDIYDDDSYEDYDYGWDEPDDDEEDL